jgi:type II secretory pathway pseudopilin PulG
MKASFPGSGAADGYTYIGLLLLIAIMTVGLAAIGEVWRTSVQRDKEAELLFVGEEFRRAITLYYDSTPGAVKQLPRTLEELLRDRRYPTVRRYLRKIYRDPITGTQEWGLIKGEGDTIVGVHSVSQGAPFKRAGFPSQYESFSTARTYADWRFVRGETGGGSNDTAPAAGAAPAVKPAAAGPQQRDPAQGHAPSYPEAKQ